MFKLVVLSALLAVAAAKPGYLHGGVAAYAAAYPAPAVVAAPLTATAFTKNVHYAATPVVTGYTAQVIKPNLGAIATPAEVVSQEKVIAPARSVATVTQQITQVQPEVTVHKVPVEVPVAAPAVATYAAAPAVATYAAAPAVATYAAAPAISYAAAPAISYAAGPAYSYAAAPAYSYGAYPVGLNAIAYNAGGVHLKTIGANGLITKIH